MDLLIEEGYTYLGNSMADDIPHYWVTDSASRRNLLAMPYYYHFDDLFFLMFPAPGGGTGLENPETLFNLETAIGLPTWRQTTDPIGTAPTAGFTQK